MVQRSKHHGRGDRYKQSPVGQDRHQKICGKIVAVDKGRSGNDRGIACQEQDTQARQNPQQPAAPLTSERQEDQQRQRGEQRQDAGKTVAGGVEIFPKEAGIHEAVCHDAECHHCHTQDAPITAADEADKQYQHQKEGCPGDGRSSEGLGDQAAFIGIAAVDLCFGGTCLDGVGLCPFREGLGDDQGFALVVHRQTDGDRVPVPFIHRKVQVSDPVFLLREVGIDQHTVQPDGNGGFTHTDLQCGVVQLLGHHAGIIEGLAQFQSRVAAYTIGDQLCDCFTLLGVDGPALTVIIGGVNFYHIIPEAGGKIQGNILHGPCVYHQTKGTYNAQNQRSDHRDMFLQSAFQSDSPPDKPVHNK